MDNSGRLRESNIFVEWMLVVFAGLVLFLPFLSLQFDTNGLIEAAAIESGRNLLHKNHLLYRAVGYALYHAFQLCGYSGRAIVVLQATNAVCGALGISFAYLTYRTASNNRKAAACGTLLLATSFTFWLFSTDASYITLAGLFASGSVAAYLCMKRTWLSGIASGVLTALAILTWQASIFLIPALVLLAPIRHNDSRKTRFRHAVAYVLTAGVLSGLCYLTIATIRAPHRDAASIVRWLSSYGEGGTLPMWGRWEPARGAIAANNALRSIVPTPLAVPLSELRGNRGNVQLGRIAVDVSLVGFAVLALLTLPRIRSKAKYFLAAYACFVPFVVWWDPFEPKWFLIPNVFLAGFFAMASEAWFDRRRSPAVIAGIILFMAATNFVTTIGPRHRDIGSDRRMAQCVSQHMGATDLLIAAEWGWPDYLEYLHDRHMLSVVGEFPGIGEAIERVRQQGGRVYELDPDEYSDSHLAWLQSQSGVTRQDLKRLADQPAFTCDGRTIFSVRM